MPAKIVNLRQARKSRARDDKRAAADENAARHGVSKGERARAAAEKTRDDAHLDGHKVKE